jgi:NAD-dependent deacetylase
MEKKKIVILTGAGVSKESGIPTFRDSKESLWNNHKIDDVATIEAWGKNPSLVIDFYNERRKNLKEVEPNEAHIQIARLQEKFDVEIITQNVDDLHERAGSKNILHLHGELTKAKSSGTHSDIKDIGYEDIKMGDLCSDGHQMRPMVVWFGEMVPGLQSAADKVYDADIVMVVGTSFTVYPAASLMTYAKSDTPIYIVDPSEPPLKALSEREYSNGIASTGDRKYSHYRHPATIGMKMLVDRLMADDFVLLPI